MNNNSKPLLLIVEDNFTQRKVMTMIAEKSGYSAITAGSGKEALTSVCVDRRDIAVVLMDWSLPDMDGLECCRRIRLFEKQYGGRVPIIAVTGHVLDQHRTQCLESGMDDFLPKPFSLEEFRLIVQKWQRVPGQSFCPGVSSGQFEQHRLF
jgi:CheY-like chemotaxis protein